MIYITIECDSCPKKVTAVTRRRALAIAHQEGWGLIGEGETAICPHCIVASKSLERLAKEFGRDAPDSLKLASDAELKAIIAADVAKLADCLDAVGRDAPDLSEAPC